MKKYIPVYVRIPVIFAFIFVCLELFIDSGDRPAFIKYPLISLCLVVIFIILVALEVMIHALNKMTYNLLSEEQRQKLDAENALELKDRMWFKKLKGYFVKVKPVEEEADILLHHDYDGIRELDNVLPPWWVNLFYACIVFAIIYLVRFHIFEGQDQKAEFDTEMADAKLAVEEYKKTAKDLIDFNTVVQLTEPSDIASGKKVFETNCVACHRPDAGGAIGPNLTDEYWLLGGGIKNVFHTITEGGRDGKGMVAWKGTLKPSEIQQVASYVLSLQGSNPKNPKEPQGDIWKEDAKAPENIK